MPRTLHASQVLPDAAGNSRVFLGNRRPDEVLEDVDTFTKAQNRRALRAEKKAKQMLKSQGVRDPVTRSLRDMITAAKLSGKPIIGFILSKFQVDAIGEELKEILVMPSEDTSVTGGGGSIQGVPYELDPGLFARGVAFHDQIQFNDALSRLWEFKRKLKNRDGIRSSIQPGNGEL
jgi:hypothetical protein